MIPSVHSLLILMFLLRQKKCRKYDKIYHSLQQPNNRKLSHRIFLLLLSYDSFPIRDVCLMFLNDKFRYACND